MFPPGPEPGEQRKKDGFGSRLWQNDDLPMVENSRPCVDSKQGESAISRRRRGREISLCWKRGCTPTYIGQEGCHPPPLPHLGLSHKGGEVRRQGGMGPSPWCQAQ